MNFDREKKDFVYWARLLNKRGLVTARSGNISHNLGENRILITPHNSYLGQLKKREVLLVNSDGTVFSGEGAITSEKNLHLSVYKKFPETKVVIHAHSPFTTAFFNFFDALHIFSFEARFYLGAIPVIPQETPTVTDIEPVLKALEKSNVVVLKQHGVVAVGKSFQEAFSLVELLEEQAKVNLFIRRPQIANVSPSVSQDEAKPKMKQEFEPKSKQESRPEPQSESKAEQQFSFKTETQPAEYVQRYKVLSKEHGERLQEVINNDAQAQALGRQYDLTCTMAIKNSQTSDALCFYYVKGKVVKIDNSDNAEFVISGDETMLRKVFNREVDPFVAATQGKVETKGDFSKMSRWFPVMTRTFKLWEQVPVE